MNLSKAHSELDRLFDIFNEKKFDNKLSKPIIIIQSTGKKPLYGYCTLDKLWQGVNDEEASCYEIGISAEHLSRDVYGICGTLIHEMVHLMNVGLGVRDTANNYIYHNKRFKTSAEAVGLIIEKAPKIGWSKTSLTDELKAYVDTLNIDAGAFSFFRQQIMKPKVENPNKQYRFKCPECGETIYSKNKDLKISCDSCELDTGNTYYFEIQIKE